MAGRHEQLWDWNKDYFLRNNPFMLEFTPEGPRYKPQKFFNFEIQEDAAENPVEDSKEPNKESNEYKETTTYVPMYTQTTWNFKELLLSLFPVSDTQVEELWNIGKDRIKDEELFKKKGQTPFVEYRDKAGNAHGTYLFDLLKGTDKDGIFTSKDGNLIIRYPDNVFVKIDKDEEGNLRWNTNTGLNKIGTSRQAALNLPYSKHEDRHKYISEVDLVLEGGMFALSQEARDSYDSMWAGRLGPEGSIEARKLFIKRALKQLVGENAYNKYVDKIDKSKAPLELIDNNTFVEAAFLIPEYKEILKAVIADALMSYYKDLAQYTGVKEPSNADVASAIGSLYEWTDPSKEHNMLSAFAGNAWTELGKTVGSVPYELFILDDPVGNPLIARINLVISRISNLVSDPIKELAKLALKNNNSTYLKDIGYSEKAFDDLAASVFPQYEIDNDDAKYTDEEKVELYTQFLVEASTFGESVAAERLRKDILNRLAKNQGILEKAIRTLEFIAEEAISLGLQALNFTLPGNVIHQYNAITSDKPYHEALVDSYLNNALSNYAYGLSTTGKLLPSKLQEYLNKGISDLALNREYGAEEDFVDVNTIFDATKIVGYLVGSKGSSALLNVAGKGSARLSAAAMKRANKILAAGKGVTKGAVALTKTSKLLDVNTKLIHLWSPIASTISMDAGYAKDVYESKFRESKAHVYNTEYNPETGEEINSYTPQFLSSIEGKVLKELADLPFGTDLVSKRREITELLASEYLETAKSNALKSAGVTWLLTMIPDVPIALTLKKSLWSKSNIEAIENMKKRTRRLFGMKEKNTIGKYVSNIEFDPKTGKAIITEAKDYTRRQFARDFFSGAKGGFISNYLQDWGVAAGEGQFKELMMLYIDQRYNTKGFDAINYDFGKVATAAAGGAGEAVFAKTSFRDGLYGALAPLWANPSLNTSTLRMQRKQGIKDENGKKLNYAQLLYLNFTMNSGLWNLTFGFSKVKESKARERKMFVLLLLNWFDNNGEALISNVNSLIDLSLAEQEAASSGNLLNFMKTKAGQALTTAIIINLLKGTNSKSELGNMLLAHLTSRAERKEFTEEDMQGIIQTLQEFNATREAIESQTGERITNDLFKLILESLGVDESLYTAISDLVDLGRTKADFGTNSNKLMAAALNLITENAKEMQQLIKDVEQALTQAIIHFSDANVDPALIQAYAKGLAAKRMLARLASKNHAKLTSVKERAGQEIRKNYNIETQAIDEKEIIKKAEFLTEYNWSTEEAQLTQESYKKQIEDIDAAITRNKNKLRELEENKHADETTVDKKKIKEKIKEIKEDISDLKATKKLLTKMHNKISEQINSFAGLHDLTADEFLSLPLELQYKVIKYYQEHKNEPSKFPNLFPIIEDFLGHADNFLDEEHGYIRMLSSLVAAALLLRKLNDNSLNELETYEMSAYAAKIRNKAAAKLYADRYRKLFEDILHALDPNTGNYLISSNEDAAYRKLIQAYNEAVEDAQMSVIPEMVYGVHQAFEDVADLTSEYFNSNLKKLKDRYDLNKKTAKELLQIVKQHSGIPIGDVRLREMELLLDYAIVNKGFDKNSLKELSNFISMNGDFYELDGQEAQSIIDLLNKYKEELHGDAGDITQIQARLNSYQNIIDQSIEAKQKKEQDNAPKSTERTVESLLKAFELATLNLAVLSLLSYFAPVFTSKGTSGLNQVATLLRLLGFSSALINSKDEYDTLLMVVSNILYKTLTDNNIQITDNKVLEEKALELAELEILDYRLGDMWNGLVKAAILLVTLSLKNTRQITKIATTPNKDFVASKRSYNTFSFVVNEEAGLPQYKAASEFLESKNPQTFLLNYKVSPDTNMVFITLENVTNTTMTEMGGAYNATEHTPIFGAIQVKADTGVNIDGVDYQIIGVLPVSSAEMSASIVRRLVDPSKKTQVIKDAGSALSTKITTKTRFSINTDVDPVLINSQNIGNPSIALGTGRFIIDQDSKLRFNVAPGANEVMRNTANWPVVEVLNINLTTNAKGQKWEETTDKVNFNSRTKKFTEALKSIVLSIFLSEQRQLEAKSWTKTGKISKEGERTINNTHDFSTLDISVDITPEGQKVTKRLDVNLSRHISLGNNYLYSIEYDALDGSVSLAIKDLTIEGNDLIIKSWKLAADLTAGSVKIDIPESVLNTILSELADLQGIDSKGEETMVAKWQVYNGNFIISNANTTEFLIEKKTPYINDAIEDGILYTLDVTVTTDVIIEPVVTKDANIQVSKISDTFEYVTDSVVTALETATVGDDWQGIRDTIMALNIAIEIKEAALKTLETLETMSKEAHPISVDHKPNENVLRKNHEALTDSALIAAVIGSCVDNATRIFFSNRWKNSSLSSDQLLSARKQAILDATKGVLNRSEVEFLIEGLVQLENEFKQKGWAVIANNVYITDADLKNGKGENQLVGEVDLLAVDLNTGRIIIIDMKTSNLSTFVLSNTDYLGQVSGYYDGFKYRLALSGLEVFPENLFLCVLKTAPTNSSYFHVDRNNARRESTGEVITPIVRLPENAEASVFVRPTKREDGTTPAIFQRVNVPYSRNASLSWQSKRLSETRQIIELSRIRVLESILDGLDIDKLYKLSEKVYFPEGTFTVHERAYLAYLAKLRMKLYPDYKAPATQAATTVELPQNIKEAIEVYSNFGNDAIANVAIVEENGLKYIRYEFMRNPNIENPTDDDIITVEIKADRFQEAEFKNYVSAIEKMLSGEEYAVDERSLLMKYFRSYSQTLEVQLDDPAEIKEGSLTPTNIETKPEAEC